MMRGVLFDFDGVIANSKIIHFKSWQFAVNMILKENLTLRSGDIKSGASPEIIAKDLCALYNIKDQSEDLLSFKNDYLKRNINQVNCTDQIGIVFDYLGQQNIPFGISSNASNTFVKRCVAHWGFQVPVIYGYEDYEFPKPNAEPYLKLAASLRIDKKDFGDVYIYEDSQLGIEAALASGMRTIYIKSHCEVSSEFVQKVDFKFNSVYESLGLLKSLTNK